MKRIKKTVALLVGVFGAFWAPVPDFFSLSARIDVPQAVYSTADSLIFGEKQNLASPGMTTTSKVMAVAESFLGTPYVPGCLEHHGEEKLVVNLRELDCWTYVEYSLAIALSNKTNFELFSKNVQQLRYWEGKVNGYGSRIHYFTGWLLQAEKSGLLQDITASLGGIKYQKKIGYITARPTKFPKIQDKKAFNDLISAEKRINAHDWYYIPKNRINQMEHLIEEGDIICLTSAKPDLDIAHQGFAVKLNGKIYLMHASSLSGKVIVSRQPLAQYVLAQRGQSGIMVARLK